MASAMAAGRPLALGGALCEKTWIALELLLVVLLSLAALIENIGIPTDLLSELFSAVFK